MGAGEPSTWARRGFLDLVDRSFTASYPLAPRSLRDIPYGRWRELDPADTVRFYAPRLHEIGMIGSTPRSVIERGTDRGFLEALRRELKA